MAIKKIVLKSWIINYSNMIAFGQCKFYTTPTSVVVPGGTETINNSTYVSPNITATSSVAAYYASYGFLGHAFTHTVGSDIRIYNHWLTQGAAGTGVITVTFTTPLKALAKVEFSNYASGYGGVSGFVMEVYDENNALLKSYTVSGQAADTSIKTVYTKELAFLCLLQEGTKIKYLNGTTWADAGNAPVTKVMFDSYGMLEIPAMSYVNLLSSPQILVMADSNTRQINTTVYTNEVFYAVSFDGGVTFMSRASGGWLPVTDVYNQGMTKSQLEAISLAQFREVFVAGTLHIKIALKSNYYLNTSYVDSISVTLPETFQLGNYYIQTYANHYDTRDWIRINSVTIQQTVPVGADIRYAFSRDGKTSWEVYEDGWTYITLDELATRGMTRTQVQSIISGQWDLMIWENSSNTLDVIIYLMNTNLDSSPSVDHINIDYTAIVESTDTTSINIPVPDLGYRNVLVNDTYTLKLAEGLSYDSEVVDYDFYTTPDRIKLKPLTMGTCIGGKTSPIYGFEVINSYENETFDVALRATKNGAPAKELSTYALLPDAPVDNEKTIVEMSLTPDEHFSPVYPLSFRLRPSEKRLIYIRVKPTLTTVGNDTFQITLSGRPV
jgi:hypothetical protein